MSLSCDQAQALLHLHLDTRQGPPYEPDLTSHLRVCPHCQALALVPNIYEAGNSIVPAGFSDRVLARLNGTEPRRFSLSSLLWSSLVLAACVAIGSYLYLKDPVGSPSQPKPSTVKSADSRDFAFQMPKFQVPSIGWNNLPSVDFRSMTPKLEVPTESPLDTAKPIVLAVGETLGNSVAPLAYSAKQAISNLSEQLPLEQVKQVWQYLKAKS